jgi:hypothetical protein
MGLFPDQERAQKRHGPAITILGIEQPLDPQLVDQLRPEQSQKNHEQKQRFPARGLENWLGGQPQSKHWQRLSVKAVGSKFHRP